MRISTLMKAFLVLTRIRKDPDLAHRLTVALARHLRTGYRFTWPQLAWWEDRGFNSLLDLYGEKNHFNTQRRWFLRQAVRMVGGVAGDSAECGVCLGCGSHIILEGNRLAQAPRHHHIFDSFAGLSPPTNRDGGYWREGDLCAAEDLVTNNLLRSGSRAFTCYKGWIPDRFREVADRTFAFVHIDVNLFDPTRDSLAFFYERMNAGGIIVCDDYGFTTCPGATRACDEVLQGRPERMIPLPDGGGFLIKGLSIPT